MNRQIIPRRTFLYVVVVLRREFIPIACLQNANAKIVFESWLIINEAYYIMIAKNGREGFYAMYTISKESKTKSEWE
jgi:hypothetical protein